MTPEEQARVTIDNLLQQAGWAVQDSRSANLYAATRRGGARVPAEARPRPGRLPALSWAAKRPAWSRPSPWAARSPAWSVQSEKYGAGLPDNLPAHRRPLPFLYESTGQETQFTNRLDPEPRSRNVFAFHTPDALAAWLDADEVAPAGERRGCRIGCRLPGAAQPAARAAEYAGPERGRPMGRAGEGY